MAETLTNIAVEVGEPLVTTGWKGQTFEVNLQKIWLSLRDDKVLGNVYWIAVSQEFSTHKLQNDIAKTFDLDISNEDDEKKRAAKLSLAFRRKKKFVLLLDNLWNGIATEKIGISPEMDGFKLIITSATLEYLAPEVLELAGNAARDNKKTRIVPRHIQLAVRNDEQLSKLLGDVTIANGGVMPNIHNLLLPKKTGGSSKPSVDED
ncbi:unnamed protein product [Fraxinus pennsylvanica]|uniref:Histone H2A n=1 Tax=Fraxinus pennsylvanica TaxID=56036 RepID=A0AAD1ZPY1_9LAMI|nr:unnamed protein product [Fraxinus pennsylvanica]